MLCNLDEYNIPLLSHLLTDYPTKSAVEIDLFVQNRPNSPIVKIDEDFVCKDGKYEWLYVADIT